MQENSINNDNFNNKASFLLSLAWALMPVVILIEQSLKLDQILGNLFLMYITVLGMFTFLFIALYNYKKYKTSGVNYFTQCLSASPWNLALLAMLFWSFLASILADDLQLAFYGTSYRNDGFFTYCIYAAIYCCTQITKNETQREKILQCLLIASWPLCLVTLLQFLNYSTAFFGIFYQERVIYNMKYAAVFYHINHYAYYLTTIIAVSVGLYLEAKNKLVQIFYLLTFIINTWCLIINNTFGCYLAALFICIVAPALFYKRKRNLNLKKNFTPLLLFLLITIASSQIVTNNFQVLSSDLKDIATENSAAKNAGSKRWELWTNGLDMLKAKPIFGYGPENLKKEYLARDIDQDRPHNEYLQHTLFLGIPALILYLAALYLLLTKWFLNLQNLEISTFVSGLAVIAYLCSAFFGNTMFYTTVYLFLLLGYISQVKNYFK